MKNIFLALLTLMFLTVNGFSQEDFQKVKNEVTQIKKEHLSNFNEENLLFDLYPNPARQEVNILLRNELLNNTELTIFDLAGRVAYSQLLSENQDKITLDISAYSNGIYFIKLQSGNKVSTQKLIVD